jgi:WhiB family redox-sensing transcriptional regulator
MDDAKCAQISPAVFFPDSRTEYPKAIKFCKVCTVRLDCLAFALAAEKEKDGSKRTGIFGGMTPVERERLQETLDKMMEKEYESQV